MAIRIERVGDVAIVIANGDFLFEADIDELSAAFARLIGEEGHRKILVDASQTRSMNAQAYGVLLHAGRQASEIHGHMILCGMDRGIHDLVDVGTRYLGTPFKIVDSCEEGLKALLEA